MKTHYSPSKVKPPTPDLKPPSYVHHVDTLLSVQVVRASHNLGNEPALDQEKHYEAVESL